MYITNNNTDYPCKSFKSGKETKIYSGLPEDFPETVSGEITLKADSGHIMRTDIADDYLYQSFENGILTLTNIPKPEPSEPADVTEGVSTDDMAGAILEGVNDI
jgi:hypothetical protein